MSVLSCTSYRALHLDCRACTICMYTLYTHSLHPIQFNSIQLFYPSSGTSPQSPPPIQQGQLGMMGHCRQGPTCYRGHHSPLQQDTLTKPEANPLNPLGHCGRHSKRDLPRSHKTLKKANKSSRKTNQRRAGATGRSKVDMVSYHQALCS